MNDSLSLSLYQLIWLIRSPSRVPSIFPTSNTIDQDEAAIRHWIAFDLSLWLTRCASRPIGVADWAQNRRSHIFYSRGNGKICSQITRICLCGIALDSIEPLRFIPQISLLLLFLPGASTFSQWICQIDARDKRTHVRRGRSRNSLDYYFYWWCVRWQRTATAAAAAAERNRARTSRVEARVNGIAKLIRLCRLHWDAPNEIEFIMGAVRKSIDVIHQMREFWCEVRGCGWKLRSKWLHMVLLGRLSFACGRMFLINLSTEKMMNDRCQTMGTNYFSTTNPAPARLHTIMNNRRPLSVAKHKNRKI